MMARCELAFCALIVACALVIGCSGGGSSEGGNSGGGGSNGGGGAPAPLVVTTASLPNAIQGQSYRQALQASGGTPPYTWSLPTMPSPLPSGLTMGSDGTISGTPAAAPNSGQNYTFAAQVKDSANQTASSAQLSIAVVSQLVVVTASLPYATQGRAYSQTLQATGGTPPYAWSLPNASFPLPSGLTIASDGTISGTPAAAFNSGQNYPLVFQVKDSTNQTTNSVQILLTLIDNLAVVIYGSPPAGNVGINYANSFGTSGGLGPFSWTLLPGSTSPPPGLSISGNGASGINIAGVPTSPGTFHFTLQVSDGESPPQVANTAETVTINNNLIITSGALSANRGVEGKPYQATLQAVGGTPPYTWALATGYSLLPGLQLMPNGLITGTPTATAPGGTNVTVTDSGTPTPLTTTGSIIVEVNPPFVFSSSTMYDAIIGQSYRGFIPISGGIAPYPNVSLISGATPPGLIFPTSWAGGLITLGGTATTAGTYNFTLSVTDSETPPDTEQQALTLRVVPQLLIQQTPTLSNGLVGQPYTYAFQASGGALPYAWQLGPPSPPGLMIDPATGVLSGTPTAPFNGPLTVLVTDSTNLFLADQGSQIQPALRILGRIGIGTSALPPIATNSNVGIQLAGAGGTGQYTWTVVSQNLPSGITFDPSTATISGQTSQTGTFSVTIQVSDAGPPSQTSAPITLPLTVASNLGRNDSPATASPLSNGTYLASISPVADPPSGVAAPDSDYYQLTANPGAIVTIETAAQRLNPPSPLDTVLEVVDSNKQQLAFCTGAPANTTGPFIAPCINDDLQQGVSTDSEVTLQVPAGNSGPLTFYAHVIDFRGDARPDFIYTITISGVN